MKIGIDVRLWTETGVGRYIRNLVEELQKIDKKNSYILFSYKDSDKEVRKIVKNPNWRIVETGIRWHSISEQLRFAGIIKRQKLDLMHFTYFSIPRRYSGAFIVTIHDLIINHFPTGRASTHIFPIYFLKRQAYLSVIKSTSKKARKIIAVSNATKTEIIDHLNVSPDKISVIYEGVDKSFIKPTDSKIKGPFILYVGNNYPHKNIERMLLGFKFAQKPKNAKVVFVGKKDFFYQTILDFVNENKMENQIIFAGEVTDSQLAGYYANASATIVPSLMEGFGLPALEAMGNGCFVICSNIPSLAEVCRDAAVYFNPFDANDIAIAIEKAFFGQNSLNIKKGLDISKKFSWEKMARETLKIYESSVSL